MSIYKEILKKYWGYDDFRDLQEEIITSVCQGKDTLALMPTGGGKSLTFQVPSLSMEGICLVITPLVALMKDQVNNLKKNGIRAAAIYSGMTRQEIVLTLDNCHYGNFKFLYVSPERLSTTLFRERIVNMSINLIAVDEAHCISQWGYDFRPSYLNISEIRTYLPEVPILALTATATASVVEDIQERLQFKEKNVFRKSFERKNLAYVVRQTEDKEKEMLSILKKTSGSAVVYVSSRKNSKEFASLLRKNGISADFFHAGLTNETKDARQAAWKSGECRVIVATNAFGMGIDKADVRMVIHMDVPDSIEAYFQEAGRAGRDGQKAFAVLLYHKSDSIRLKKHLSDSFPDKDYIRRVYESLSSYFQVAVGEGLGVLYAFNLTDFCTKFKYNFLHAFNALKILEQAGYLELTDDIDNPSRVYILTKRDELYKLKLDNSKFDSLLEILLRSYTGLFTDFINIDEELIGKRIGTSGEDVYNQLLALSRIGVIHYIPRKKTPYIIYKVKREETERVAIRKNVYEDRLERSQIRIKGVIGYATDNQICRSRQLLLYFGQQKAEDCGHCDVCLSKNETGMSRYEYNKYSAAITAILKDKPLMNKELIDSVEGDKNRIIKVLRHMCEDGKVKYNDEKHIFFI